MVLTPLSVNKFTLAVTTTLCMKNLIQFNLMLVKNIQLLINHNF